MNPFFSVLPLVGAALFSSTAQTTPEQNFWKWFQENEAVLFDFEKDQERMFDKLLTQMHRVQPNLTFEFGPKENGRREFIISADGIKEAFPKVESLYASAPALPRWKFVKFRPRREPFDISYAGVNVVAKSVRVDAERQGQKADVTVFVPNYSKAQNRAYSAIVFLLLDQALGEYDVETRVGAIEIEDLAEAPSRAGSLEDLQRTFDRFFPKH